MTDNWNAYWGNEANRGKWLKSDSAVVDLLEKLDRTKVKDVLDLGCGVGRHALLFAKAGFAVTAVDASPEALAGLRSEAAKAGTQIKIIEGNYTEDLFPEASFDFILSFNVVYHGYRQDFQKAIGLIYRWLRPGGLVFFTCPTRRDAKYGNGEQAAPNTYRPLNSIVPGDIHYFADEADILDLLREFRHVAKDVNEQHRERNGISLLLSYWQILATK